jgi:5-hydroxyisourate hydrolase
MARLTTHVLDTARGRPAAGLTIDLYAIGTGRRKITTAVTNQDGRVDRPLLAGAECKPGTYELVFHAGAYHEQSEAVRPAGVFLDLIPVRFAIVDDGHYHVPLLLSPYGYATYRGS